VHGSIAFMMLNRIIAVLKIPEWSILRLLILPTPHTSLAPAPALREVLQIIDHEAASCRSVVGNRTMHKGMRLEMLPACGLS
jgi:hypothetical protein